MFLLRSGIGYCRVGLQLVLSHNPFTTRAHNRPNNVRSDTLSQCLRCRGPYGYLGYLINLSRPAQWLNVESMLSASLSRRDCATRDLQPSTLLSMDLEVSGLIASGLLPTGTGCAQHPLWLSSSGKSGMVAQTWDCATLQQPYNNGIVFSIYSMCLNAQ